MELQKRRTRLRDETTVKVTSLFGRQKVTDSRSCEPDGLGGEVGHSPWRWHPAPAPAGRGWGSAAAPPPRAPSRLERGAQPEPGPRVRRGDGALSARGPRGRPTLTGTCKDVTQPRRPCAPPDPQRGWRPEEPRHPASLPCCSCC